VRSLPPQSRSAIVFPSFFPPLSSVRDPPFFFGVIITALSCPTDVVNPPPFPSFSEFAHLPFLFPPGGDKHVLLTFFPPPPVPGVHHLALEHNCSGCPPRLARHLPLLFSDVPRRISLHGSRSVDKNVGICCVLLAEVCLCV